MLNSHTGLFILLSIMSSAKTKVNNNLCQSVFHKLINNIKC